MQNSLKNGLDEGKNLRVYFYKDSLIIFFKMMLTLTTCMKYSFEIIHTRNNPLQT